LKSTPQPNSINDKNTEETDEVEGNREPDEDEDEDEDEESSFITPDNIKNPSLHPKADSKGKPRKTLAPKQGSILNENYNDSKQTDRENGNQEEI
jgi:hypothetical protein